MIKISNLNKYYFKGDAREIHVINDVNLVLPDNGLVTFFGPSGSGKTTLLNVIGGLDKPSSGTIDYGDIIFTKYNMDAIDDYRKNNFGYIYQNYLLMNDKTVYQNLKEALQIIGVFNVDEQKKRIEYTLKKVNLYKYRNKIVGNLSGGQMQRVSIARALLKNAKIIIADEPTGNIDSENTLEVMNILKKISADTLVLLVTHELDIANFYSDRIIKIEDGKIISDVVNESKNLNNQAADKKIYLKDYQKETANYGMELYIDENSALDNLGLKLVVKNDTIYISSNKKVVNIKESSIDLVDDYQKNIVKRKEEELHFDTSWYKEDKKLSFFERLKYYFQTTFASYTHKKRKRSAKFLNFIYCFLGIFLAICFILINNYDGSKLNPAYPVDNLYVLDEGLDTDSDYLTPYMKKDTLIAACNDSIIEDIFDVVTYTFYFTYRPNFALSYYASCDSSVFYFDDDIKMLYGSSPTKKTEIVISKELAQTVINAMDSSLNINSLIGTKVTNYYGNTEYEIVGISDSSNTICYIDRLSYLSSGDDNYVLGNIFYKDAVNYQLISGSNISDSTEILISANVSNASNLVGSSLEFNNNTYKIVGTFSSSNDLCKIITYDKNESLFQYNFDNATCDVIDDDFTMMYLNKASYIICDGNVPSSNLEVLVNKNCPYSDAEINALTGLRVVGHYLPDYDSFMFDAKRNYSMCLVKSLNVKLSNSDEINGIALKFYDDNKANNYFSEQNVKIISLYDYTYNVAKLNNKDAYKRIYVMIAVLFLIVIFYAYFTSRSSMLNEIYDIGVVRSLGKSRKVIISEYAVMSFIKSTFTLTITYLITYAIYLIGALKVTSITGGKISFNIGYFLLGLLLNYVINIIAGILPIILLTKSTPSEINSKYDI